MTEITTAFGYVVLVCTVPSLLAIVPLLFLAWTWKAVRRYVFAFLAIPLACIGVFVHDFYANLNSGSVWVPAYDYFLPALFGWGGSQMRIAKMRFDENRMEFDVVNFRRGPYRFAMSVPNRLGEFISVRHDIHFHCRFFS